MKEKLKGSIDELFGSLKKSPLKDVFETLSGKKDEPKKEPEWPSVRVRQSKKDSK